MVSKWSTRTLGELCTISSGKSAKYTKTLEQTVKVYGANGVIGSYSETNFDDGFLVGRVGACGFVHKIDEPVWASDNTLTIKVQNPGICHKSFLGYELNWLDLAKYATKTAQPLLTQGFLKGIELAVPPVSEQRKIAAILSSVDDAITATQRIIDQTEVVKRGLMQQLLTKGIGHTTFKQTEIGKIPTEWDVISLGDIITELKAGVSVNSENRKKSDGEYGILKTSAVTYGIFQPNEHKAILPDEVARAKETPLEDHIIVSRMNTPALVGASAYVDRDYPDLFLPDRLWQVYVHSSRTTSCKWFSYVLRWDQMRSRIGEIATGTSGSMKNISKSVFLSLKVAIPRIHEQRKIADVLTSLDEREHIERDSLLRLQTLKDSLMQVLLTGKVRVNVDELSEVSV